MCAILVVIGLSALSGSIHGDWLDGKANDRSGMLIHDSQNSVCFQYNGFGFKEILAPETVFGMSKKSQP